MSPPIALKPDVAVGADEKKRVGDMRQVIARVGAWKLGSEGARYVGGGAIEPHRRDRPRSPPPAIRGHNGLSRATQVIRVLRMQDDRLDLGNISRIHITEASEDTANKPSRHIATGFVGAPALISIASTAANAVMFRMPRTVALCVRM